jgi:hypothetical protein
MSITVRRTNGTTLLELADKTINTTETSLALVGRGAVGYGQATAENFIKLLENFANSTAPSRPLTGQLWFDTTARTIKVFDGNRWTTISGGGGFGDTGALPGSNNRTSGYTGVLIETANSSYAVGVGISEGQIITVQSAVQIPHGELPAQITIENKSYPFASRFPDGIAAGVTMATDPTGYVFAGTATSARYADLAERYEASEPMSPGDVVEIGGEKEICLSCTEASTEVFGVISTAPGMMLNSQAGTDETHPFVALAGRVPVKVVGPVKKGARLVSSHIPGVAKAAKGDEPHQAIIGRALQNKETEEISLIEVVLGGVK